MTFEKRIYGEEHCPRCNAMAQLRAHPHENTDMVQLRLDCPKCKLSKYVKLTTRKFLILERKEKQYLDMLQNARTAAQRRGILRMLERTRKQKFVAEVKP